jgi:hypothetical protein
VTLFALSQKASAHWRKVIALGFEKLFLLFIDIAQGNIGTIAVSNSYRFKIITKAIIVLFCRSIHDHWLM